MSDTEPDPETFEAAKEIHEKKEEVLGEVREEQNELLEAAAAEEELVVEEHEEVHIGDATLTVKTQIEGRVMRRVDTLQDAEQPPGTMLDTVVSILSEQTERIAANDSAAESDEEIKQFWHSWINRNDVNTAAELAITRVIEEPLDLERERRQEAVRKFRGE